jgi:hypothetical protein
MSLASYVVAISALALTLAGAVVVGARLQRQLLSDADRPLACLVGILIGTCYLVVVGEALGTAHLFSRWPLAIGSALPAMAIASRIPRPRSSRRVLHLRRPDIGQLAALICVALIVAQCLTAIVVTGRTGIFFVDSLAYHLPWAAWFAQTHSTTSIAHFAPGVQTSYYPLNDELLNGMGMAVLGRDSLSLLIGCGHLIVTTLAAYCIGARFRRGPVAICAISPLLVTFGAFSASAINDWASIWPLLTTVAIGLHAYASSNKDSARQHGAGVATAMGLGIGLAIGTKLDMLAPALALLAAALLTSRALRSRRNLGIAVIATALAGGYWYLRTFIAVGSPLPSLALPLLPHVPAPVVTAEGQTVAHYITRGDIWTDYFLPGLHNLFGPVWPATIVTAGSGLATALLSRRNPLLRGVAASALIGLLAYVVTPTTAGGPAGHPILFAANLRYTWPTLALALTTFPASHLAQRWPSVCSAALLGLTGATMTSELAWRGSTPRLAAGWVACALIVAGAGVLVHAFARPRLLGGPLVIAVGLTGALAFCYPLQQRYLHDRYRGDTSVAGALFAHLQSPTSTRVGVVGLNPQYPAWGPALANRVRYLGVIRADHVFGDISDCTTFRRALSRQRIQLLLLGASSAATGWTARDPDATQLFANAAGSIWSIKRQSNHENCA